MYRQPVRSEVLRAFAEASETACGYNGAGRSLLKHSANYTVSGCDVLQGRLVALYAPNSDEVRLFKQTLGPMAYTAAILVSRCTRVVLA